MKRKIFVAFMIVFTILLAIHLFISLICGPPAGSGELIRYIVGAAGISLLLPAGFTFFFLATLHLSKRLEEKESETVVEEEVQENKNNFYIPSNAQILTLVNTLAEEKRLTPEEKERLLSYLEDL